MTGPIGVQALLSTLPGVAAGDPGSLLIPASQASPAADFLAFLEQTAAASTPGQDAASSETSKQNTSGSLPFSMSDRVEPKEKKPGEGDPTGAGSLLNVLLMSDLRSSLLTPAPVPSVPVPAGTAPAQVLADATAGTAQQNAAEGTSDALAPDTRLTPALDVAVPGRRPVSWLVTHPPINVSSDGFTTNGDAPTGASGTAADDQTVKAEAPSSDALSPLPLPSATDSVSTLPSPIAPPVAGPAALPSLEIRGQSPAEVQQPSEASIANLSSPSALSGPQPQPTLGLTGKAPTNSDAGEGQAPILAQKSASDKARRPDAVRKETDLELPPDPSTTMPAVPIPQQQAQPVPQVADPRVQVLPAPDALPTTDALPATDQALLTGSAQAIQPDSIPASTTPAPHADAAPAAALAFALRLMQQSAPTAEPSPDQNATAVSAPEPVAPAPVVTTVKPSDSASIPVKPLTPQLPPLESQSTPASDSPLSGTKPDISIQPAPDSSNHSVESSNRHAKPATPASPGGHQPETDERSDSIAKSTDLPVSTQEHPKLAESMGISAPRDFTTSVATKSEMPASRPQMDFQPPPSSAASPSAGPEEPIHHQAQQLSLSVSDANNQQKVEVRLVDRAGELHISVRTPDETLTHSLREDLSSLTAKLGQSGFEAEAFVPTSGGFDNPSRQSSSDNPELPYGRQNSGNGSNPQQQQQSPQDDRGQRPTWLEEMESSLAQNQLRRR